MREEMSLRLPTPRHKRVELHAVNRDGSKLEPITFTGRFNDFSQFSADGKRLVFASNRKARCPHEINIFLVDWVD
jgi:Tol biopolymer transport system component